MPVKTRRLRHTNSMVRERASDDEDTVHDLSVKDDDDDGGGYWVTPLLENEPVWMQVDTGTRVFMISEAVYKEKLKHFAL